MRKRLLSFLFLTLATAVVACAGGAPALEYGLPTPPDVRYDYSDTTVVTVSVMGQSMELSQRGVAEYAVSFTPAPSGVNVTLSVATLDATIRSPMGSPVRLDEGDIGGALVFALDREGNAVVAEQMSMPSEASMMVSDLALAHAFFPRLPGRAVTVGESWVDTVSYEGRQGQGSVSERSVVRYTVAGDTIVAGRTLLSISFEGTSAASGDMEIAGFPISQSTETDLEGRVLWDEDRRLMIESVKTSSGSGTVAVPMSPNPIPIRVRVRQQARLRGG